MSARADVAIILAAGRGQRLGGGGPKPLLVLDGKTILRRQIEALRQAGVGRLVVVVGYERALIEDEVERTVDPLGMTATYVENPDYATTNTIVSMYLAREHMKETFLALNGDVVFPADMLDILQVSQRPSAMAVDVRLCGDEEVKVVVDEHGRVTRIGKILDPNACLGEYIGVGKFRPEVGAAFSESLRRCVEDEQRLKDFYEKALDAVADRVELSVVPFAGRPVIEIDFPEDLARAHASIVPRIAAIHGEIGKPDEPFEP